MILNNYLTYEQFLEKTFREFWITLVRRRQKFEKCLKEFGRKSDCGQPFMDFNETIEEEAFGFVSRALLHEGIMYYPGD